MVLIPCLGICVLLQTIIGETTAGFLKLGMKKMICFSQMVCFLEIYLEFP